jgi:hypothetical protein
MKYRPTESRRLEPGAYVAQLVAASETTSLKGDQVLELTLTINGVEIKDRLYNTEAAAWRIKQMRASFGFVDDAAEVEFEPQTMVGKLCRVEVHFGAERTSGKYVGKRFLEVKTYLEAGAKPEEQADEIPF